ncbi:hypothetical protein IF2G_10079 [Cordyceps javanica]|nr:hypothetical protein IF2G_10079 [Cordyceps javanica]
MTSAQRRWCSLASVKHTHVRPVQEHLSYPLAQKITHHPHGCIHWSMQNPGRQYGLPTTHRSKVCCSYGPYQYGPYNPSLSRLVSVCCVIFCSPVPGFENRHAETRRY